MQHFYTPHFIPILPLSNYQAKSCCLTSSTGLGHVSLDSGSPNVMYNQPNIHQGRFMKKIPLIFYFAFFTSPSCQALFPLLDVERRPAQAPQVKVFEIIFIHCFVAWCFFPHFFTFGNILAAPHAAPTSSATSLPFNQLIGGAVRKWHHHIKMAKTPCHMQGWDNGCLA